MYVELNEILIHIYLLLDHWWNIAIIQDNLCIKDNEVVAAALHDPTPCIMDSCKILLLLL